MMLLQRHFLAKIKCARSRSVSYFRACARLSAGHVGFDRDSIAAVCPYFKSADDCRPARVGTGSQEKDAAARRKKRKLKRFYTYFISAADAFKITPTFS